MSNSARSTAAARQAPVAREACGLALACDVIGDRWTLLILREAFYGVTRFEAVRSDLDAPRAILSDRLTALVQNGILDRVRYQEEGARSRHEYKLTAKGRDLGLALMALFEWGNRHIRSEPSPVQVVEAATGKALRVCAATRDGRIVEPSAATIRLRRT
jgi:DNA-binding HxlR family transcriptional regulator